MSDRARIFSDQVMKKDDIFDDEFEMEKEEMSFETDIPVSGAVLGVYKLNWQKLNSLYFL